MPHKTKLSTKCNIQDRSLLQYTETNTSFSAVLYTLRQVFIISQVVCIAFHRLLASLRTLFNTAFFSGSIFGGNVLKSKSKDSLPCCKCSGAQAPEKLHLVTFHMASNSSLIHSLYFLLGFLSQNQLWPPPLRSSSDITVLHTREGIRKVSYSWKKARKIFPLPGSVQGQVGWSLSSLVWWKMSLLTAGDLEPDDL